MIGAEALVVVLSAATGVDVFDHVPEVLPLPCVVLEPADPYLTKTETFGDDYDVRVSAWVLVELVGNEQANEDLDALLATVLPVVRAAGWDLEGVSRPGPYTIAETYLAHGTTLTLASTTTLPGETP